MATGDRTPDSNLVGNFQRQLRLMGVRIDELTRALAAAEARIDALEDAPRKKGRRDPADRVIEAA